MIHNESYAYSVAPEGKKMVRDFPSLERSSSIMSRFWSRKKIRRSKPVFSAIRTTVGSSR